MSTFVAQASSLPMKFISTLFAIAAAAALAAEKPVPEKDTVENYVQQSKTGSGDERVKTGQFYFPRLQFKCREDVPDKWDIHPVGDQKLRESIKRLTNINILAEPVVVNLDKLDEMCEFPYVFMTSEGDFVLPEKHVQNMREYLNRGGFLYADDCVLHMVGNNFYRAFVREMKRVFPDNPMRPIPNDHEIFKIFFKLNRIPFLQGKNDPPMGLFDKKTGRLLAMVTSGDLHCGWVGFGNLNKDECRRAVEMGVNIVVYCLTH